jgi:FkbM family methyltransferase
VAKATRTESPPVLDPDARLAYFDQAEPYTPYLATEAGDALFLVKTEDRHIGRSLFGKRGRGEHRILARAVAAIRGIFGPDAIAESGFVDVGANIGTTTVPALRTHGFGSAVAIEPEPENLRLLRMNVLLNDLQERVTILPVAASNENGWSELAVNQSRGGKHLIVGGGRKLGRKQRAEDILLKVETVTLDHLAESGALEPDRIGLLWMDAEAHEGQILAGASTLLARGTPLVLEWNRGMLDRWGDRALLQQALSAEYTHFAGLHRNAEPGASRFPLQTVDRLSDYEEESKTDILVLRLTPDQAAEISALDGFMDSASLVEPPAPARHAPDLISRARGRLSRMRARR